MGLVVDTTRPDSIFRVKFRKFQLFNALRHIVGHRSLFVLPIRQRKQAVPAVVPPSIGLKEVPHASAF